MRFMKEDETYTETDEKHLKCCQHTSKNYLIVMLILIDVYCQKSNRNQFSRLLILHYNLMNLVVQLTN